MTPWLLLPLMLLQAPSAPPGAPAGAQAPAPRITWTDLPQSLPQQLRDSVRFGYLEVPADHADPGGGTIRLAIALLPARAADRLPDPVVSIAGGPGLPAIELHMSIRAQGPHPLDAYRDRRDLVIIDARGHGFSQPHTCRELYGAEPLTESAAAEQRWLARLEACSGVLRAAGVRPETLSSVQAAHDLELLRRALDAPQLNLVGLSYGSRIAAETVRQLPASIRAVYYSGPVPAGYFGEVSRNDDAEQLLGTLFARCASRPACAGAYPRLQADFDSVMARLRRTPQRVELPNSDAADGQIVVTEEVMRQGLAEVLLNRQLAAGAPLLIHSLAERGFGLLAAMAGPLMGEIGDADVDPATFLSFWCNDGVVSNLSPAHLQQRCRTWLGDAWTGRRAEPVRSDVPGLIEAGELDPRTPPSHARFLAAAMPRAHVVILPWYGHERPPDCSIRISRAFFDAPDAPPDVTCTDSIPPIEFVTGIVPSRWIGTAVGRTVRRPWLAALPAAAALLLLGPLFVIPVRAFRARHAGLRHHTGAAALALLAVAATGVTLLLGLAAALFAGANEHIIIPIIGLQQEWAWLLALPWILLALTLAAAWLALRERGSAGAGPIMNASVLIGAMLVISFWVFNAFA